MDDSTTFFNKSHSFIVLYLSFMGQDLLHELCIPWNLLQHLDEQYVDMELLEQISKLEELFVKLVTFKALQIREFALLLFKGSFLSLRHGLFLFHFGSCMLRLPPLEMLRVRHPILIFGACGCRSLR